MSPEYWEIQNNRKEHKGDIELDPNVKKSLELPPSAHFRCEGHGASNWNTTARIEAEVDGNQLSYFLKVGISWKEARYMLEGEYESSKLINKAIPNLSPKPLAWGKCEKPGGDFDKYFLIFTFHSLLEDKPKPRPDIPRFAEAVAQLHTLSMKEYATSNPDEKFGFHVTTYNGTLPQDNTWTKSWREFYVTGMERMLALEEEARGPSDELKKLSEPFLRKVIPRLLDPMETNGRSIKPVLLHGDLWLGNVSCQKASENNDPLLFDAAAFWGHHEYELATLRPLADDWINECYRAYHELVPKSDPEEDWDARNALYATSVCFIGSYAILLRLTSFLRRLIIHDSAIYPDQPHFREM
ncbi:fructosamine kinase [Metarhizium robertsii]|uniref:protein-ribulosamine 3-kinase n=1 Tax=Metarhizium robertsii TaxID=568076 RepID=A0A0A1V0Z8_9HYPO|nr:fructosamine kinase [Metarhizium robertsii]